MNNVAYDPSKIRLGIWLAVSTSASYRSSNDERQSVAAGGVADRLLVGDPMIFAKAEEVDAHDVLQPTGPVVDIVVAVIVVVVVTGNSAFEGLLGLKLVWFVEAFNGF